MTENTGVISLTSEQINWIADYLTHDVPNYAYAYRQISEWVGDQLDQTRRVWFEQADDINLGRGQASIFIRSFTQIGLAVTGNPTLTNGEVSQLSNLIARQVLQFLRLWMRRVLAGTRGAEPQMAFLAKEVDGAALPANGDGALPCTA
jgi:hypothetical protein